MSMEIGKSPKRRTRKPTSPVNPAAFLYIYIYICDLVALVEEEDQVTGMSLKLMTTCGQKDSTTAPILPFTTHRP